MRKAADRARKTQRSKQLTMTRLQRSTKRDAHDEPMIRHGAAGYAYLIVLSGECSTFVNWLLLLLHEVANPAVLGRTDVDEFKTEAANGGRACDAFVYIMKMMKPWRNDSASDP